MKRPVKRPIQENTIKPGNLVCAFLKQIKNYSWSIFVTESTSFKLHNFYHLKKLICACFFNVFIKVCTISRAGFTRTAINQKIVIAAFEKRKQSWKVKKKFITFKRTVFFCKLSNFEIYEITFKEIMSMFVSFFIWSV